MSSNMFRTGVVIGTGAELEVGGDKCGFRPSRVEIVNATDGSKHTWQDTMADGEVFEAKNGAGFTLRTSGGITPQADGFLIGTQGNLNASGDVLHFSAWG